MIILTDTDLTIKGKMNKLNFIKTKISYTKNTIKNVIWHPTKQEKIFENDASSKVLTCKLKIGK